MKKMQLNVLTNSKSKVSSHYFIKNNGKIITLVPDFILHGMLEFHLGKIINQLINILLV